MGQVKSKSSRRRAIDSQQILPKVPDDLRFRVLIIGRANAGKTSILQRVCDTTDSPEIYRLGPQGERQRVQLEVSQERGLHNVEDEIIFANHGGYVFHDSRGFEAGGEDELKTVKAFVRRRSRERRLEDRLHAIWYCIPMDNDRPSLDLKHFDKICPDKNVPVIAVFTKYDQFRRNIMMKLEDQHRDPALLNHEMERTFGEHYLANLGRSAPFVHLEGMHKEGQQCIELIKTTASALHSGVVALILLSVQKDNLELNIRKAVEWTHDKFTPGFKDVEKVIKSCIVAFPSLWFFVSLFLLVPHVILTFIPLHLIER